MAKLAARSLFLLLVLGACLGLAAAPQIKISLGHSGPVKAVAFSPDGTLVLSGSADRTLKVWETTTGRELRTLPAGGDQGGLEATAFTPDGRAAVTRSVGGSSRVWDLATGRELPPPFVRGKDAQASQRILYAGDGRTAFVVAGARALEIWDVRSGRLRKALPGHPAVDALQLVASRDGRFLATLPFALTSAEPNVVKVWDPATGRKVATLSGHADKVLAAAFAPDGLTLLTASGDRTLRLWDTRTGRVLKSLSGHGAQVTAVAFSPDGTHALSGSEDNTVRLWDLATGRDERTMAGHSEPVTAVAFSPDGALALSGSADHSLKLWNLATGAEVRTLASPSGPVWSLLAQPGGNQVAAIQGNHVTQALPEGAYAGRRFTRGLLYRLKAWTFPAGQKVLDCADNVKRAAFAPDGKTLATSPTFGGPMVLREAGTGRVLRAFQAPAGYYEVATLAFSQDGRRVLTASEKGPLKVWDPATGQELRSWPFPEAGPALVAFAPDGQRALCMPERQYGAPGFPLFLLDLATGRTLLTLPGHAGNVLAAAFSPNGKTVLTASWDKTLKLWDLGTGHLLRTLPGPPQEVTALAFAPTGQTAVSACVDGTLRSWDLASGALLRTFRGHGDAVKALALAPDGATLFSGSDDGTLRTWDLASGGELTASMIDNDGEWLTWTPQGHFEGSAKAAHAYVYIVDGLRTLGLDQVEESFYRPDRVQAQFLDRSGTPGTGASALAGLLQGGAAPVVTFAGNAAGNGGRDVEVVVRVKPTGGGVGRVTLFLDGVPVVLAKAGRGVKVTAGTAGPEREFRQTVTLHSGRNLLEATAFNGIGSVESPRAALALDWAGQGGEPRLYVLAVAIDSYRDGDLRLKYPVADARSLGAALSAGSPGLFLPGATRTLYDAEATRAGIGAAFDELGAIVGPDDVFLLYLAGHGVASEGDGDYYFLPVDFRFSGREAVAASGLSKRFLVDNLAKIRAGKTIVLFDTCNSGAFLTGGARGISEKTAVDRLKRAMGRATLVASGNDQSAMEGYEGHGVFTWALLEGLSGKADGNQDGYITVSELTSHIENRVPEISYRKWGYEQIPQKELPREDFPLAKITGTRYSDRPK